MKILTDLNRRLKQDLVSSFDMASLSASLGEKRQALAWLERGCEKRDFWLVELNAWPWFDSLRDDPRFLNVLRRIGFPK